MSHYAKVLDGKVIHVIVADAEFFDTFVDTSPGEWIQTSYNTRGNIHYLPNSNEPSGQPALRGNYAGTGYVYDRINDVFYPPQPFPSWTINSATWEWQPPTPMPIDGNIYHWNETTKSWDQVTLNL